MTYIVPDDIALREEAKHYWPRPSQGPSFISGPHFRNTFFPLLSDAPLPPFTSKQRTLLTAPTPNAVTGQISPYDQDYKDSPEAPGAYLHGIDGTWVAAGGIGLIGIVALYFLRR